MIWFPNFRLGVLAVLAFACLSAGAQQVFTEGMVMEDMRIPLDHFDDGRIRAQLHAKQASMKARGVIEATSVTVEMFSGETGEVETLIKAESCSYDRERETLTSDTRVMMTRAGMKISGRGMSWSRATEQVRILSDVRVEFRYSMNDRRKRLSENVR